MNSRTQSDLTGEGGPSQRHQNGRSARERIRIEDHSVAGTLWFGTWLFTVGLLHLPFSTGVLARVLCPYYLGTPLSSFLPHYAPLPQAGRMLSGNRRSPGARSAAAS
jgi:hypothetical protein